MLIKPIKMLINPIEMLIKHIKMLIKPMKRLIKTIKKLIKTIKPVKLHQLRIEDIPVPAEPEHPCFPYSNSTTK